MSQKASWTLIGVLSIIGGIIALLNPVAASLTAETLAGWLFLFAGILQVFAAFRATEGRSKFWVLLGGFIAILIGIALLANPLKGVVTLTILVAFLFLTSGIMKLIAAWPLRKTELFWPLLISGAVSVLLAFMIFGNFPTSAVTFLGIMLGVELISNGVALIALARQNV